MTQMQRTLTAAQVTSRDLVDSMMNGRAISISGFPGDPGRVVQGVVNSIEHEDGSGHSFNLVIGSERVYLRAANKPVVFGLNHAHLHTEVPYRTEAPSREELFGSFLEGKPIIGRFTIKGTSLVLAGVVGAIEREDGSGHSFNVRINGETAYVRSRD